MSRSTGFKIGASALALPSLVLAWMLATHHSTANSQPKPPPPPEPQVTEKSLHVRVYKTGGSYDNVLFFTDPANPGEHCLGRTGSTPTYACYPNKAGLKVGDGGILNLVHYKTNAGDDVLMFDDPENPDLYCLGNDYGNYSCYPKPKSPGG